MKDPRDRARGSLSLIPRRFLYLVGVLSGVKALGLVLLAEAIARGVAAVAVGEPGWRDALILGVVAGLLRAAAGWAISVVSARAAIGTKESLRAELADSLLTGAPRVGSQAALATRGLDDLDDYFTSVLPSLMGVAVIPLLIGARILFADWLSAVVLIVTVPLIPIFMVLVGQYTKDRTDAAASALDRLSDHIVELAKGLPVLVGLGRVREQAAALEHISDEYRKRTMLTLRTAFLSALVLELIATISVAVVAVFVGLRILDGNLSLQVGLLVLILAPEAYTPFRELGAAYHASRSGVAALGRARELIDDRAETVPFERADHVSADRFTVSFDGRIVLMPVSFTLPDRGITALLGPSGGGKSTLLRALAGRLHADADAAGRLRAPRGTMVGWAPQHPQTVAPTVRDELALYADGVPHDRVDYFLITLGLAPLATADPARLSPGELRRLAVARALLRVEAGASLLLLDEPTAHLDDDSARVVVELIADAAMRASVIVASHDASFTTIAVQVIQLGAPGDLRERGQGRPIETVELVETAPETPLRPRAALRALAAFLRPARGRFVGAALIGTLASAFAIALTGVSAWLIVRASEQPAVMYLLVAIVGVRFFGLGRAILRYTERLVTHDAVFDSATSLRVRLWHAIARRGASSRVLQRGGTALDYLVAATDDVRDLVPRTLTPVAVGVLVSAAAVLTVFLILPAAVLPLVAMLVIAILGAPLVALLADRAAERDRLLMRTVVLRRFAAMLQSADDLRGNGVDHLVRNDLAQRDHAIGRASRRIAASRGLGVAIVLLAGCLTAVAMLDLSAPIVLAGQLEVELAAVLVLLPVALIEPLLGLVAAVQLAPALAVALTRTAELDDEQPEPSGRGTLTAPVSSLELREVSATWPGADAPAFSNASAAVEAGGWLVVEGPSGSGKSTLLTVLLGALRPSQGTLLLDGVDVETLDRDDLHRHVAWAPQEAHLFDSTLRANLLLGRARDDAPTEQELTDVMRTAGLGALLSALPAGLDTRIGSEGSHLSGGERQRLAIARTLLSRASVVLLDEPTAHLDEPTARALMSDLRDVYRDRIVVLVTHHADEVEPGDVRLRLDRAAVRV